MCHSTHNLVVTLALGINVSADCGGGGGEVYRVDRQNYIQTLPTHTQTNTHTNTVGKRFFPPLTQLVKKSTT